MWESFSLACFFSIYDVTTYDTLYITSYATKSSYDVIHFLPIFFLLTISLTLSLFFSLCLLSFAGPHFSLYAYREKLQLQDTKQITVFLCTSLIPPL